MEDGLDQEKIDVMEHVTCDLGTVYATVHTEAYNHMINTQIGRSISNIDVTQYHIYSLYWDEDVY